MTTKVSSPTSDFVIALAVTFVEIVELPRFALKKTVVAAGKNIVFDISTVVCPVVVDSVVTVIVCVAIVVKVAPSSVE